MPENNTTQPKSWRDVIKVHPAADLFPMNSDDEIREMGENIKANGLTSPIVFTPDRQLIDGRNRLEACERARLTIVLGAIQPIDIVGLPNSGQISIVTDIDPYAYVVSANLHRRHLTPEQKRALVAKLLQANPTKSNLQTAKLAKVDDKTVAAVRRKLEATSEIPKLPKTVGADGKARRARAPQKPKHTAPKQTDLEGFTGTPQPAAVVGTRSAMDRFYDCLKQMRATVSQVMREIEPARRPGLLKELRMALDDLAVAMSPPEEPGYVQGESEPLEIPDFLRRHKAAAEVDA